MKRRDFFRICAAGAALGAPDLFAAKDLRPRFYSRAQLVDGRGRPLKAARLAAGENYIFHYPFSFISYRDQSTASGTMRPNVIHCCSEHSEYDPVSGARVVGGPAPQPLSAVLLEYGGGSDTLHAIGTLGGEMFNAFFARFEFKLALDYGAARARQRVADRTVVKALQEFCKRQVRC